MAIGLAWVSSVGWGARMLFTYENTPGAPGASAGRWPAGSKIARPQGKFTLVMLAHPECPCTRASLAELEILMARLPGKLVALVEFRKPGADQREVQGMALWNRAAAIPGVSVGFDQDGAAVEEFGAEVSGQALLYDPEGLLVFSGGITAARGHEGDNAGVDAVIQRVNGGQAPFRTAVFGCSLRDPGARTLEKESSWKR